MFTIYGLSNCDSTQKAINWLKKNKLQPVFFDLRTEGINQEILQQWCNESSWQELLNKRSTTWRSISKEEQNLITNEKAAIEIMTAHSNLIKRPVLLRNQKVILIGYSEKTYNSLLQ